MSAWIGSKVLWRCLIRRVLVLLVVIVVGRRADARPMPAPPNPDPRVNLDVSVQGYSSYNAGTGIYTYSYTVINDTRSGNSVKTFGLAPIEYLVSVGSPMHWTGFDRWESRIDAAVWTVTDNVGSLPPDSLDTGDMPPSPYCIAPGQRILDFSIASRQPPTTVNWYAQGEDTLTDVEAEPFEGLLDPDDGFFGLMSVKGTTIGPDIHSVVGVSGDPSPAMAAVLYRATPNPFAAGTAITFQIRDGARVCLEVFDVQGRRIRALLNQRVPAGPHSLNWDGTDQAGARAPSGVYFVRILVDGIELGRLTLVHLR